MPQIHAFLIDIQKRNIKPTTLVWDKSGIVSLTECDASLCKTYLLPGFVDAHVHIESSLMVPSEFAKVAVKHGTVATVSDPHEIANVLGIEGIDYMINNAATVPFHFFFGAPSCVPASIFETNGANINALDIKNLIARNDIWYLAEVMNYPGVIHKDADLIDKINHTHTQQKPVDGHAPGVRGSDLAMYASAGITTDHECFTLDEALDKIANGMKVQIREGSAACNFEALHSLITSHPNQTMLCSDDKHPDSLQDGHINLLVKRALAKGHDLFDVLQTAILNTIIHYQLPIGMLRLGDPADFIEIDNIEKFNVLRTVIKGEAVFENNQSKIQTEKAPIINCFHHYKISENELKMPWNGEQVIDVIAAIDGQLITLKEKHKPLVVNGFFESDIDNDILKIVVVNRYHKAKPAIGFIRNFGLKSGAIASTVAHDSHNLIAIGTNDAQLCQIINQVMESGGGLAALNGNESHLLALPVAGLMSNEPAELITEQYIKLDHFVKQELRSSLRAPFMSLSFMALLVIPHLKLSDLGLFDGDKFELVN